MSDMAGMAYPFCGYPTRVGRVPLAIETWWEPWHWPVKRFRWFNPMGLRMQGEKVILGKKFGVGPPRGANFCDNCEAVVLHPKVGGE